MGQRFRQFVCWLDSHTDQIVYPDGKIECGRCGEQLQSRSLRGNVTFVLPKKD